jgi:hypothetical protein
MVKKNIYLPVVDEEIVNPCLVTQIPVGKRVNGTFILDFKEQFIEIRRGKSLA